MNAKGMNAPSGRYTALGAVCAGTVVSGAALYQYSRNPNNFDKDGYSKNLRIPRPFVEGVIGAIGEVAQISVLYPLETIKVKCQADGLSTAAVLQQIMAQGKPLPILKALYCGFSSAALLSCLVGAVHYVSFCVSKRAAQSMGAASSAAAAVSTAATSSAGSSDGAAGKAADKVRKAAGKAAGAAAAASTDAGAADSGSGSAAGSSGGGSGLSLHDIHGHTAEVEGTGWAGAIAALCGAAATAVVESPVELFRHQAQAGIIGNNFLGEMVTATKRGGPGALYLGFLPFCLESIPFDMVELCTFSYLGDAYAAAQRDPRLRSFTERLGPHVADLAIGGASGAAAVLISMPFDCIKTYLQIHSAAISGKGAAAQTAAFFATGAAMVKARGPGALFVGTLPRLAQQVPSSTICWWAIEACRRSLEPYTTKS